MFMIIVSSGWIDPFTVTVCSSSCLGYCSFRIFARCCHWEFYSNAQMLLVISSANDLPYCFLHQSFKGLCTTFKTCACKVIPRGRMTKSVLNVFVLFLY